MDFKWTPEQKALKDNAEEFARKQKRDDIIELDRACTFARDLWQAYADFGVFKLMVPETLDGMGLDFLSCVAVMEGLGKGGNDNGLLFSINAHIWSCVEPLLAFGTEAQKAAYIPSLCNGERIGVNAMTEPESGSDAFSLKTNATEAEAYYLLNGSKTFITNGDIADLVLVFARIRNGDGADTIGCLLVEKDTPGFSVSKTISKMGLRTSPFNQLYFDDCRIPRENLLGRPEMGRHIFNFAMEGERAFILATQIGQMEQQLDRCIEHARVRRQFGRPIIKHQAVAHLLADMKVRLETARLLVYKSAWLKNQGRNTVQFSAITKLHVSEAAIQNSLSAMKILGGYGYTTEYEQERQMRDALGGLFYSGTSEIMRNLIAELLV